MHISNRFDTNFHAVQQHIDAMGLAAPEPARAPSPFLATVSALTQQAIDDNRAAESLSYQALRGKADLTEVIPAVMAAESQLRTVVAFRDAVIGAYQQVQRMPI